MTIHRLSLDIGTNSIGWCLLEIERRNDERAPAGVVDMGVRIFPDGRNPKDGSSNAVKRRQARAMRRNRDRFVERRRKLINALVSAGLLPEDEKEQRELSLLDPYALRLRGIEEELTRYEFGRALFHLNQRRGFKSNRKSDSKTKETGAIKEALRNQQAEIAEYGARTFGEFLFLRREKGESVRSRLNTRRTVDPNGREKNQEYYDFYPSRELLSEEFEKLWAMQLQFHGKLLATEVKNKIFTIIFDQRPLKPPVAGKCTFERNEDRAPKVLPIVQRCRIYQELNHLQIVDTRTLRGRPLALHERDTLAPFFCTPKARKSGKAEVTFDHMRAALGLSDGSRFSLESEKRTSLEADTTSALLAHKDRFGARWHQFSDEDQERIIYSLLDTDDEEALIQWLIETWSVDRQHAGCIADTPLPEGYARLGITATRKIVAELVQEVIPYSDAVVRAGYASHSEFSAQKRYERLPYYGAVLERHVIPDPLLHGDPEAPLEKQFGKVTNPTVHIALNQLRKVVNEVIKRYGAPEEIHVEVLRDLKNSLKKKKEIEAEQTKNQAENKECARRLREEFHETVNRENIQRLRLWNELDAMDHICPYTAETISAAILFSEEVEIDHILPFSRTLDDSMANKILCKRRANREKGNRTPFEAWGDKEAYADILARTAVLPKSKRWRFSEEAMQTYTKDRDFIARQLTDSQYIARLSRDYLAVLFNPGESHKVVCLPGRLTGMFRHHLGLDDILDEINPSREHDPASKGEKNRNDHRNHAVDALVIGLMDRAFLQRAASVNARLESTGVHKLLSDFPEPWPGFRSSAKEALRKIVVSHKPDHGIEDALHNDTAYGFTKRPDVRGEAVHRVFTDKIDLKNIEKIKGKHLRAELVARLTGLDIDAAFQRMEAIDHGEDALAELLPGDHDEKAVKAQIAEFFSEKGIRRVRIIEQIALIPICGKTGHAYKGVKPDGNAYLDVFENSKGKWESDLITIFDANNIKRSFASPTCAAIDDQRRKIIRLFNRDMIEIEYSGKRRIFYIQKMSEGKITLTEHFEADADRRSRNDNDPFCLITRSIEALRKAKARFLTVTPSGTIRYLSDEPNDSARS